MQQFVPWSLTSVAPLFIPLPPTSFIGATVPPAENYFAKIVKKHDLYIVENPYDTQFIRCVNYANNRLIDEDTGEIIYDDMTEAEMREFDGDISETIEPPATTNSNDVLTKEKAEVVTRKKSFVVQYAGEAYGAGAMYYLLQEEAAKRQIPLNGNVWSLSLTGPNKKNKKHSARPWFKRNHLWLIIGAEIE